MNARIGIGYDSHRLSPGRPLIIGGVEIPFEKGLEGHSDADVLCHAVIDSILGALGAGDIGTHFPDDDPRWKDCSSISMLSTVLQMAENDGFEVAWIDSIIHAERPKMKDHIDKMKEAISAAGVPAGRISIKAKTAEGIGAIGHGEVIAARAVCLLHRL